MSSFATTISSSSNNIRPTTPTPGLVDLTNLTTTSTTINITTAAPPTGDLQAGGSNSTNGTSASSLDTSLTPSSGSLLDALNSSLPSFPGISIADLYLPDEEAGTRDSTFRLSLVPNVTSTVSPSFNVTSGCTDLTSSCAGSDIIKTRVYTKEDLWAENDHFARTLIPAMVLIGVLMIIGTLGNSLVVYVYGFRFKSATQHFLICCLACFDLLMCLVAMPSEMADLRYHHTFSSLAACKLLRFITMFSSISSTFTLLTIARDRHRRVTRPLTKQMTPKRARIWQLVNVGGALFFAWPTLVMTGLRSSETRLAGLMGTDCSWSNTFAKTKFPLAYNAVLGSGFSIIVFLLSVLYFRIWKTAKTHRVNMNNKRKSAGGGASGISDEDGRGGFRSTGDEVDAPIKRGRRDGDVESGRKTVKDSSAWLGIFETCAPVDADSGVDRENPNNMDGSREKSHGPGSKTRLDAMKNDVNELDNSPRRFLKRGDKSTPSTRKQNETNANENEAEPQRKATVNKTGCSEMNYPPSPSLSCSSSRSPSLPTRSLSSSPALRARACHSWSIRSDDLRPLSSLMDAVSRSLAQSRAFDSAELSLPDSQPFNFCGQKSNSKRFRRSQSLDDASKGEPRSRLEYNESLPASYDPEEKNDVEKKFSEAGGFQEFSVQSSGNDTTASKPSPENPVDAKHENSAETSEKVASDESQTSLEHEQQKLNKNNPSPDQDQDEDDNELAYWSIPLSKFSHLKSSLSRPMDIPELDVPTSEDEEQNINTNEEKSCRIYDLQKNTRNIYVPDDDPGLDNSFHEENSDDRSSHYCSEKRRSTVVSVLDRYRIRMGSMASLDNITIDSAKFSTKKSPLGLDKTTIVAFAVTSVFVLSFLPYLVLMFVRGFLKDFDYSLDNASLCLYNIFVRFYLINSAVNPIMYGVLNSRFRVECVRIFKRIFCCVPRKNNALA